MEKLFNTQPVDESLVPSIQQLEDLWAQTRPIVDDLNDEQMMTKKLCEGLAQGISKSELIRESKEGLESGGQLPYFWYIISYD